MLNSAHMLRCAVLCITVLQVIAPQVVRHLDLAGHVWPQQGEAKPEVRAAHTSQTAAGI